MDFWKIPKKCKNIILFHNCKNAKIRLIFFADVTNVEKNQKYD